MSPWLSVAESALGLKEIPGKEHNPIIIKWLTQLGAWWKEDETPWCGTFAAHCLRECGIPIPTHWYRAKAYLDWGVKLTQPVYGCLAILSRPGGAHVTFIVGRDAYGRPVGIGGNQGNKVSYASFDQSRVLGYRYPVGYEYSMKPLPVIQRNEASSTNEA